MCLCGETTTIRFEDSALRSQKSFSFAITERQGSLLAANSIPIQSTRWKTDLLNAAFGSGVDECADL